MTRTAAYRPPTTAPSRVLEVHAHDQVRTYVLVEDPACPERGLEYPAERIIVLRDLGDSKALLHELMHAILGDLVATAEDPHSHRVISALTRGLWEAGWRPTEVAS